MTYIDTKALRTMAADWTVEPGDIRNALESAADALDGARGEAAQATSAARGWRARFDGAMARIAAALAEPPCPFDCPCTVADEIRHELTRETS